MNEKLKQLEEILNQNNRIIKVLKCYFIDETKMKFKEDIIKCLEYVAKREEEALSIICNLQ